MTTGGLHRVSPPPWSITSADNLWAGRQTIQDDVLLRLGTDGDQVLLNRSTSLAANTALTDVLIGTPVSPIAIAANSLIVSNTIQDGDFVLAARDGANSRVFLHYDASVPRLYIFNPTEQDLGFEVSSNIDVVRYTNLAPAPWLALWHAGGTRAAPLATTDATGLGEVAGIGYDGTNWHNMVELRAFSLAVPTATSWPGGFSISAAAVNEASGNHIARMTLDAVATVFGDGDATGSNVYTGLARLTHSDTNTYPGLQLIGANAGAVASTNKAKLAIYHFNADANAGEIVFIKSRAASPPTATTVANLDWLGIIAFMGADGTNWYTSGGSIGIQVTGTPASNRLPTSLRFATAAGAADDDAAEKWRISPVGIFTSLGAVPTNVTTDGAIIADGGIAFTDVLNAWIDDATHGTGTTTLYIGNASILVSGGALGTPASGTGTNITGIPAANILAGSFGAGAYVISTSLQAVTIELGHATDTTLARVSAGVVSIEGATILTNNGVNFGPGGVTSITVVGGQITAIS